MCASILTFMLLLSLAGCGMRGEIEQDMDAGVNGGFEITRNGLPVNWLLYTPSTVPQADFDIVLDTVVFREGTQSLRYDVRECRNTGGWDSPGFTNEFYEVGKFKGDAVYRLSFWVQNKGTTFRVDAGPVSEKKGDVNILLKADRSINEWDMFSYDISIPEGSWLRFQVSILEPGQFWIDDVRIEKV